MPVIRRREQSAVTIMILYVNSSDGCPPTSKQVASCRRSYHNLINNSGTLANSLFVSQGVYGVL